VSDDSEAVRVTIFGEEYTIRSDMDEAYTRACAEHVDAAIQEAHLHSHVSEPHKAAILAALEITDQLFRARSERDEILRTATRRASEMRERVEEALEG
jgi:cell division protein ZapA